MPTISNRQRKILTFFKIKHSDTMPAGAAGWEIGRLLADLINQQRWAKYLYLTNDFGAESHEVMPFDESTLAACIIPESWKGSQVEVVAKQELAASILGDGSPFDMPQPAVVFVGMAFVFTGKFNHGTRKQCEQTATDRGGTIKGDSEVSVCDYLVIGAQGNPTWSSGAYGRKIEAAVVSRRGSGRPAIISEEHWAVHLVPVAT